MAQPEMQQSSIPPWVHINEDDQQLIPSPSTTQHYIKPPPPSRYKPGRKLDHLRSAEPPFLSIPIADHQARWRPFMESGPYPSQAREGGARVVDQAWMDEHMPALRDQWDPADEILVDAHPETAKGFSGLMYKGKWLVSPERQERTVRLFWRLLLKNPFVPLAVRLTLLAYSAAALGLAASIFLAVRHTNADPNQYNNCAYRASTYMAIIIGTVAIPYLGYVTWDEYMSKPLGLRSVAAKTLLLLLDLFFIVFSASNLSLAFDTLFDHRWACYNERLTVKGSPLERVAATCPDNPSICYQQKALSSVLLVGLCAWLFTFSISIMRVVEKLRPD